MSRRQNHIPRAFRRIIFLIHAIVRATAGALIEENFTIRFTSCTPLLPLQFEIILHRLK